MPWPISPKFLKNPHECSENKVLHLPHACRRSIKSQLVLPAIQWNRILFVKSDLRFEIRNHNCLHIHVHIAYSGIGHVWATTAPKQPWGQIWFEISALINLCSMSLWPGLWKQYKLLPVSHRHKQTYHVAKSTLLRAYCIKLQRGMFPSPLHIGHIASSNN